MWRMILEEQVKPAEQQDKLLMAKLYSQIQENIKLASALNLGTPVVAQIKAMVDRANESKSLYIGKQNTGPRGLPGSEESKDPSLY